MRHPGLSITVLALALAAGVPGPLAAAEGGNRIARYGNLLAVTAPASSPDDARTAAALRAKVTVDFADERIEDVAAFLHRATGANIIVAPAVAADAPPITLKAAGMTAANVVDWVARLASCRAEHVDGALYFTRDAGGGRKVTRLYDVSSLITTVPDFPGPELAMTADQGRNGFTLIGADAPSDDRDQRADELIDLITKQVAPGTWDR